MTDTYRKLIENIPLEPAPERLNQAISRKIQIYQTERLRRFRLVNLFLALISVLAFVPAAIYVQKSAVESGFWDYASLLLSDTTYVFGHLNQYLGLIGETIPLISLTLVIALIAVLTLSIYEMAYYQSRLSRFMAKASFT